MIGLRIQIPLENPSQKVYTYICIRGNLTVWIFGPEVNHPVHMLWTIYDKTDFRFRFPLKNRPECKVKVPQSERFWCELFLAFGYMLQYTCYRPDMEKRTSGSDSGGQITPYTKSNRAKRSRLNFSHRLVIAVSLLSTTEVLLIPVPATNMKCIKAWKFSTSCNNTSIQQLYFVSLYYFAFGCQPPLPLGTALGAPPKTGYPLAPIVAVIPARGCHDPARRCHDPARRCHGRRRCRWPWCPSSVL